MSIERRKFIRFEVPLDVTLRNSGSGNHYFFGIIKNFSRYGCCIESIRTNLSLNDSLELEFKHPHKDVLVPASGTIVWKQQLDDDKCLLGVNIRDMNREAKSEIMDFAYDIWLENNIKMNTYSIIREKV